MKQQVSEVIDSRLAPEQASDALEEIARSDDGCKTWRNYHLIGDVIRGESVSGQCLLSRVRDQLESEPTVLAPKGGVHTAPSKAGGHAEAVRSAGLFAIAASLALVAVLTLSPNTGLRDREVASNNIQSNPGVGSIASATTPVSTSTPASPSDAMETFEDEFGQMLVEHGEFTATSGLNGLLAYAKLVSNDSLER